MLVKRPTIQEAWRSMGALSIQTFTHTKLAAAKGLLHNRKIYQNTTSAEKLATSIISKHAHRSSCVTHMLFPLRSHKGKGKLEFLLSGGTTWYYVVIASRQQIPKALTADTRNSQ